MSKINLALLFLVLCAGGPTLATSNSADAEFSSGTERVALLELFTSEGCSSCPPADRWLATLKNEAGLWSDFIPIAFHVDYWDYIGWEDRFAQSQFGDRQRRYAAEGGARFVYTPGVFYDGSEWVGWRSAPDISASGEQVGTLTARVSGDTLAVHFDPSNVIDADIKAHIAVLGMNLSTRVRAGENKGKTLSHDFVALGVTSVPLKKSGTAYSTTVELPVVDDIGSDQAIAVWISDVKTQAPIQATGGFLP